MKKNKSEVVKISRFDLKWAINHAFINGCIFKGSDKSPIERYPEVLKQGEQENLKKVLALLGK